MLLTKRGAFVIDPVGQNRGSRSRFDRSLSIAKLTSPETLRNFPVESYVDSVPDSVPVETPGSQSTLSACRNRKLIKKHSETANSNNKATLLAPIVISLSYHV